VLTHAAAAAALLADDLLVRPGALFAVLMAAVEAAAISLLLARARRLRLLFPLAVGCTLWLVAVVLAWGAGVLAPVVSGTLAVVLATVAHEGLESRATLRATDRLIADLADRRGDHEARAGGGARERLHRLRRLQAELAGHDQLQTVLLEGLDEGVVLWNDDGTPVLANQAADNLWGDTPPLEEVRAAAAAEGGVVARRGRQLELSLRQLDGRQLGVLRDATAERELEARRREVQRLVSHELRTPLASIAGFGEMLERYQLSADELQRVAGLVRNEAERLQKMVSTFLDLERLGAGRWLDESEQLDLAGLVADRCGVLEATAALGQQRLVGKLAAKAPVRGVPMLLERVVDNLVGNAIKYTGPGSEIGVILASEGGQAVFTVSDDGPGIPQEAVGRLFERFYRVPGQSQTGSGLGLALAREVVEWHGGTIEVDSEPGRGSRFTVRLPLTGAVHRDLQPKDGE
jgi:two-component system phosphate regulon sensor histidine kinase PhoR